MTEILLPLGAAALVVYAVEVTMQWRRMAKPEVADPAPHLPADANGAVGGTAVTIDGTSYTLRPDGTLYNGDSVAGSFRLIGGSKVIVLNSTHFAYALESDGTVRLVGDVQGDRIVPVVRLAMELRAPESMSSR